MKKKKIPGLSLSGLVYRYPSTKLFTTEYITQGGAGICLVGC
jgi:hypothetical protein